MSFAIFHGDALELLRTVPSNSIDSIVTDPPGAIHFMGHDWDSNKGGRKPWVQWLTLITTECVRVLKPGGHALLWAIPRTSHWTATAVEDGGFEIRDVLTHHFGSGMPHYRDVSKAIDQKLGTSHLREVFATYTAGGNAGTSCAEKGGTYGVGVANSEAIELERTRGGSPEAQAWDGWATALRPSSEHWILARKPLEGVLAENVLRYGAGALNIDACRLRSDLATLPGVLHPSGRWPPNVAFTHSALCRRVGERSVRANGAIPDGSVAAQSERVNNVYNQLSKNRGTWKSYGNGDGTETIAEYQCALDCPIALLNAQAGYLKAGESPAKRSGMGYGSTSEGTSGKRRVFDGGSASRYFPCFEWSDLDLIEPFFYAKKPSTKEKEAGLEGFPANKNGRRNLHPTVKSAEFMRWATRLVTPPGGVCLDIFTGSGTTGVGAVLEGFHFMGFDDRAEFCAISEARIEHWARAA